MATFRLLHASDFHVSTVPFSVRRTGKRISKRLAKLIRPKLIGHDPTVWKEFVKFVYANSLAYDAILVTGDLACSGYRADLQAAHHMLTSQATHTWRTASGEPTLQFVQPLIRLLPGNHDRYRRQPLMFRPGGIVFDSVFANFWSVGQSAQALCYISRGSRTLLVLGADFSLRRGDKGERFWCIAGRYGQGKVYDDPIKELRSLTHLWRQHFANSGDDRNAAILWAVHFDPFTTDATLQLLESGELARAAADDGIRAILCGHTHESKVKPLSQKTAVYACGSTTQSHSPQGNDCQIIQIELADDPTRDPDTIRVTWYRYDSADPRNGFRELFSAFGPNLRP